MSRRRTSPELDGGRRRRDPLGCGDVGGPEGLPHELGDRDLQLEGHPLQHQRQGHDVLHRPVGAALQRDLVVLPQRVQGEGRELRSCEEDGEGRRP